jgi:hypothetical protein
MVKHANGDVVDPGLMPLDQIFEGLAISRPGAQHKVLILAVGGVVSQRVIDGHFSSPGGQMPFPDS